MACSRFQRLALFLALAMMSSASGTSFASDSSIRGQADAERICATCHVVNGAKGGTDAVPTFDEIINDRKRSDAALRGFLAVPHGAMPDFSLSRQQVDDLVEYMRSFKRN